MERLDYCENRVVKKSPEASRVEFHFILTVVLSRLVAAGANSDTPMANAWISKVALEIGLKGEEFHSALVYAGGQDWLDNDQKEGWTSLTRAGEALARA
jgi:hypothetical protein